MTVISAAWHGRGGPVPSPVPPLPAGSRRCSMLPSIAAPPQRPRCSAPARTRPSREGYASPRHAARPTATAAAAVPAGRQQGNLHNVRPGNSGAYAAAVEQARGRSARHRLPHAGMGRRSLSCTQLHALATASHKATAPLVVRSCTRASICTARRAQFAAVVGVSVCVCCCAAPARTARGANTFRGHAHAPHVALRMHYSAKPHAWRCRPNLSRRRMRCVPSRCASV